MSLKCLMFPKVYILFPAEMRRWELTNEQVEEHQQQLLGGLKEKKDGW